MPSECVVSVFVSYSNGRRMLACNTMGVGIVEYRNLENIEFEYRNLENVHLKIFHNDQRL